MPAFGEVVLVAIFLLLLEVVILLLEARRLVQGGKATLANAQLFQPNQDVTTLLPVPLHAATCDHLWETLSEKVLEMPHEKKFVLVQSCRHCGLIDKTVQVTGPAPPPKHEPPPPCSHEWESVVQQNLEMPHEKKIVAVLTCRKCGAVDKTVEATSKPPSQGWTKAECRHKWEAEKKLVLDSAYEQMLKSINEKQPYNKQPYNKVNAERKIDLDLNEAPAWMFRKTYVCIRICSECGEIDKIVTANFEVTDAENNPESMDTIQVRKNH